MMHLFSNPMLESNSIESNKYVSISRDQVITKIISTAKEKPGIKKAGYNNIMGLTVFYSGMFNIFLNQQHCCVCVCAWKNIYHLINKLIHQLRYINFILNVCTTIIGIVNNKNAWRCWERPQSRQWVLNHISMSVLSNR